MPLVKKSQIYAKSKQESRQILSTEQKDFDSLSLDLKCNNLRIVLQTLLNLDKTFSNEEEIKKLSNHQVNILDKCLLDLLKTSQDEVNICILRIALKLLVLLHTANTNHSLCDHVQDIEVYTKLLLLYESDEFIQRCCLANLAILTNYADPCLHLTNQACLTHVCDFIKDPNVNVKYDSLRLIENILYHALNWHDECFVLCHLSVPAICELFEHCKIKMVVTRCLNTLYLMSMQDVSDDIYKFPIFNWFKKFENFFIKINEIEDNKEKVIFLQTLANIGCVCFKQINQADVNALVTFIEENKDDSTVTCIGLELLIEMCQSIFCQEYTEKVDAKNFIQKMFLDSSEENVLSKAQDGLAILSQRNEYLIEMATDNELIDKLVELGVNSNISTSLRTKACGLLLTLMNEDDCCSYLVGPEETSRGSMSRTSRKTSKSFQQNFVTRAESMYKVLLEEDNMDQRVENLLLRCIQTLVSQEKTRKRDVSHKLISFLLKMFNPMNRLTRNVGLLLDVTANSLFEENFKQLFINSECLNAMFKLVMQNLNQNMIGELCHFLIAASQHVELAHVIDNLQIFQQLNKHNMNKLPHWNQTLESVLSTNLSLKFAFTNVIDFDEIITNGFYLFKHLANIDLAQFPSLAEVAQLPSLAEVAQHEYVVYVLMVTENETCKHRDLYLRKYLSDVVEILSKTQKTQNTIEENKPKITSTGQNDIKQIARYVANQMNGHDDNINEYTVDKHLSEIITNQQTSVIPIGHIKMGLDLERCLLFKILCDQVGYPCRLERDIYRNKCHCEVLIEDHAMKYLRMVVDLLEYPDNFKKAS